MCSDFRINGKYVRCNIISNHGRALKLSHEHFLLPLCWSTVKGQSNPRYHRSCWSSLPLSKTEHVRAKPIAPILMNTPQMALLIFL
ncbi:predicted protein [Botrytis cinerea T4]|uniref:Uncharacterized protein n=1 Tax=Botryotinia fuckeliana (strain T4) TaxID=999810 RepID=G2XZS2_BOTF4|nr:predicted protein [Botrytis cinerea T4]